MTVPSVDPAARPVLRHRALVRLAHWLNALCLVGMIGSGLQIYGAFARFGWKHGALGVPNPFEGRPFPEAMRLGGWLAGGLDWHFALAWPFVLTGLVYLAFLLVSGEWRALAFRPRDVRPALGMLAYYARLRRTPPPQGKHNALQKGAYTFVLALGAVAALSGFAIWKPVQLSWLVAAFGGFELARYWHFGAVWLFLAFTVVHVVAAVVSDPAAIRAIIIGTYRGRHPNHG